MLILARKSGVSIQIGDDIKITILDNKHKQVKVGVDAPDYTDYGFLYIGGGDYATGAGNGVGFPEQPGQLQRLNTPYGKLMRIDPLGGSFVRDSTTYNYGIPPSNPFANDGDPNTFDEIYAYGFRNAHRIAWDTAGAETPIVSDIGQGNIEEVNVLVAGANYGWPEQEGTFALMWTLILKQFYHFQRMTQRSDSHIPRSSMTTTRGMLSPEVSSIADPSIVISRASSYSVTLPTDAFSMWT